MAHRLAHTKNELKQQRDTLSRLQRYLPTLQLKKQQLQMELRRIEHELDQASTRLSARAREIGEWVKLLSEPVDLEAWIAIETITCSAANIAGVNVPILDEVTFTDTWPDPETTPVWTDTATRALRDLITQRVQMLVLGEQARRVRHELKTTNQRVNLFEKVKIPEAREHIRVIRIFLGDRQTADVARAKIAKRKITNLESGK